MFFTSPIWLWALSGLIIPVSIHLLSRKEGKVIYLGSLRYLDESTTRQFRAIRLNEIWLLIIRCLLIIITALLLAGLQVRTTAADQRKWVLVEPALIQPNTTTGLLDSLIKKGYERHYFTPTFPITADSLKETTDYWTLIDDLSHQSLDSVIILSHGRLTKFSGEQIALPAHTSWLTVPAPEKEYSLFQKQIADDSVIVRQVKTSENGTSAFYQRRLRSNTPDSITTLPSDTIHITIASDDKFAYDAAIFEAALKALEGIPGYPITIEKTLRDKIPSIKTDWTIVLSSQHEALPETNLIIFQHDNAAPSLLKRIAQSPKQRWHLTQRLNPGVAVQKNLTVQLAHILTDDRIVLDLYAKNDQRSIPDAFLKKSTENEQVILPASKSMSLNIYLMILLIILLLTERLVAYQRNQ